MESKLAPRLPVGRNVLQRSGRRDRAAEVVVGEIPASEKGKDNVTAWKEISARGNDGNNECSRYSKVGQSGKLPGDRPRQAVVTQAPVLQAHPVIHFARRDACLEGRESSEKQRYGSVQIDSQELEGLDVPERRGYGS